MTQGNTDLADKDAPQAAEGAPAPTIQVEVSDNSMTAFITVPGPDSGTTLTLDDARQALTDAGVVEGIDADRLGRIFSDEMFDERLVIAKGTSPLDGVDGIVQFVVDLNHDVKPKVDAKGNADYKDVSLFCVVKKGDRLAKMVPPVPGTEGKTVTGEVRESATGQPINIKLGENVAPDPENPSQVVATADGSVALKKDSLTVDPLIVIDGNVDFGTGNIDFTGTVKIRGDVKSDFSVKAQGDVEIDGVVEDSTVEAGGNVLVKMGAVGKGKGQITAGGDVTMKFCENHAATAGKDIVIGEGVMHSRLEAGGTVLVRGTKGLIVGGETIACHGVTAKTLGNEHYHKTEIAVGVNRKIMNEMTEIDEALAKSETNMEESSKVLFGLNRERKYRGELPKEKAALVRRLERLQAQLKMEREELPKERKKLEEQLLEFKSATVRVVGTVHPGVIITIQNRRTKVTEPVTRAQYQVVNEVVTPVPLAKKRK